MEINFELSINISEEIAEKLGIDESTVFDIHYEDGRLIIAVVDEDEEYYDEDDEDYYDDEEDDEYIDCTEDDCDEFEYRCPHCGKCTLDEPEAER